MHDLIHEESISKEFLSKKQNSSGKRLPPTHFFSPTPTKAGCCETDVNVTSAH